MMFFVRMERSGYGYYTLEETEINKEPTTGELREEMEKLKQQLERKIQELETAQTKLEKAEKELELKFAVLEVTNGAEANVDKTNAESSVDKVEPKEHKSKIADRRQKITANELEEWLQIERSIHRQNKICICTNALPCKDHLLDHDVRVSQPLVCYFESLVRMIRILKLQRAPKDALKPIGESLQELHRQLAMFMDLEITTHSSCVRIVDANNHILHQQGPGFDCPLAVEYGGKYCCLKHVVFPIGQIRDRKELVVYAQKRFVHLRPNQVLMMEHDKTIPSFGIVWKQ